MINETVLQSDLHQPVQVKALSGNLFTQDNRGNKITVELTDNGEPVEIGDETVTGYVIRPDNKTVAISGSTLTDKHENRASIILPQSAYAVVGQVSIVVKLGQTTIGACTAFVYRTMTDDPIDPGDTIPNLEQLLAVIGDCETATENANDAASRVGTIVAPAFDIDTENVPGDYVSDGLDLHYMPMGHVVGDTLANTRTMKMNVAIALGNTDTAIHVLDERSNEQDGFVNYGYDIYDEVAPTSTTLGVKRYKTFFVLNGSPSTNYHYVKICNNIRRTTTANTFRENMDNGIFLKEGCSYRIVVRKISGSCVETGTDTVAMPSVGFYQKGSTTRLDKEIYTDDSITIRELYYASSETEYILTFVNVTGKTYEDFLCEVTLQNLSLIRPKDEKADHIHLSKSEDVPRMDFESGADNYPMSATVSITPVLYGRNFAYIHTYGNKNLFDSKLANWRDGYVIPNDPPDYAPSSSSSYSYTRGQFVVKPNTTYTLQVNKKTGNSAALTVIYCDKDQKVISREVLVNATSSTGVKSGTFTTPADARYIQMNVPYNSSRPSEDVMIEESETMTEYVKEKSHYCKVVFPETIYGGTMTIDKDSSCTVVSEYGHIDSYNGEELSGEWISSLDTYEEGTQPTTGAEVIYKLSEPVTIKIPYTTGVRSVLGQNYMDSDVGNILSVEYYADTKSYIDNLFNSILPASGVSF